MDPAEASKVGATQLFPLPVGEKGSILAKSVRPGGVLPLPQGEKVNRERLTSLEIGLSQPDFAIFLETYRSGGS